MASMPRRVTDDSLEEINRRIQEHPGNVEHQRIFGLGQTVMVFRSNLAELRTVLEAPTKDFELAMELVQNVHRPDVRDQFMLELVQRLHNYVASAGTLVDHSRRIMRGRADSIAADFEQDKEAFLANPEVHFIRDLRNFTLHRELPFIGHRLDITNLNTGDPQWSSEIQLSAENLLAWDGWSSPAREFLETHGDVVTLAPVIDDHGRLVLGLNAGLLKALAEANQAALERVNELVVERNAILARVDVEEARQITEEWTRRSDLPADALAAEPPFPFPASEETQPAQHASSPSEPHSSAESAGEIAEPDDRQ